MTKELTTDQKHLVAKARRFYRSLKTSADANGHFDPEAGLNAMKIPVLLKKAGLSVAKLFEDRGLSEEQSSAALQELSSRYYLRGARLTYTSLMQKSAEDIPAKVKKIATQLKLAGHPEEYGLLVDDGRDSDKVFSTIAGRLQDHIEQAREREKRARANQRDAQIAEARTYFSALKDGSMDDECSPAEIHRRMAAALGNAEADVRLLDPEGNTSRLKMGRIIKEALAVAVERHGKRQETKLVNTAKGLFSLLKECRDNDLPISKYSPDTVCLKIESSLRAAGKGYDLLDETPPKPEDAGKSDEELREAKGNAVKAQLADFRRHVLFIPNPQEPLQLKPHRQRLGLESTDGVQI